MNQEPIMLWLGLTPAIGVLVSVGPKRFGKKWDRHDLESEGGRSIHAPHTKSWLCALSDQAN